MFTMRSAPTVIILCLLYEPVHTQLMEALNSYEALYKEWEHMYRNHESFGYCNLTNCLQVASDKADELANTYNEFSDDIYRYPIMVVNLYTHHIPKLHSKVNNHLMAETEDTVLQVYSELLSYAITILSSIFSNKRLTVFRGQPCRYAIPKIGETYRFGRFLSTSLSPIVALKFGHSASCATFIQIDNAIGLPIRPFSKFPGEEEILIDHTALFHVQNNLNDSAMNDTVIKDEIFHWMRRIFPTDPMEDIIQILPDVFVHLVMSNTTAVDQLVGDDEEVRNRRSNEMLKSGNSFLDEQAVDDLIKMDEAWTEYIHKIV